MLRHILFIFAQFICYLFYSCHCTEHFENVARGKDCNQSSSWDTLRPAEYAANGNTDGTFLGKRNCIVTANNDRSPWWQVNLGRPYPVYTIIVWARTGYVKRMSERVITVDGVECYRFPQLPNNNTLRKQTVNCTQGVLNGTIVRLARDRNTGQSGDGRAINLCEFEVISCSDEYWGNDCSKRCGDCHSGTQCDKVTGYCAECTDGRHGEKCDKNCSVNCAGTCDQKTGNCHSCRQPGVQLPLCSTECPDGTFGQNCFENCSENCADVCDKITGECACQAGWKSLNCSKKCEAGSYGDDCSSQCGACSKGISCNHVNGSCDQCVENFALPLCKECDDGHYGQNCSENCSENCKTSSCDNVFGHCKCKSGWMPPDCKVNASFSTTTPRPAGNVGGNKAANTGDGPPIPVIAGSVVGGIIFLVLALILLVFLIRRRHSSGKKPDEVRMMQRTDVTTDHANPVYQNERDPDSGPVSTPDTTDEQYARPTALVKPRPLQRSKPRPAQAGHMYENVGVNGEVYPRPSRRSTANMADTDTGDDVDALETADDTRAAETAYYNDPVYMTSQAATLGLDRVQQYLLDRLRGDTLDDEFENLPYGHQQDHEVGLKENNRSKNRFNSSILPYDATRVVLHGNSGPDSNDYINASYVRGFSNKTYIAAQGPKTNSVGDFWRMVWQEKITHIVMLTNLKEAGKNKCVEYWPRRGKQCKYSSVDVTGLEVEQRADCVIRTFDVKRSGGGPSRHVTQYHYVTWPDHSVPTATALVDFWRTVTTSHRNQQSPSPLLVHCSAGVGRTGTFIALDIAMDGAQKQSEIDIFTIVQRMREDRVNMVQTKSQYRFVHEAILEAYTSRHTRLALLTFNSVFPFDIDPIKTNDRIDSEFKLLNQMKVLLHKPSHTVAENEENIGKNRTLDILPDDSHLACLSSPVRGRNQYINGVFVSTFFSRRGCIMTQLPLYHTMVDIWRLVDGNDVTTIVSLGAEVDGSEADCCYWPRQEGQSKEFGPFTVTLSSKAILGQHLTSYMLSLQSRNHSYDREVYVLQYSGWTYEVPDSTPDILHLVDLINARASRDVDDDDDDDDCVDSKVIVQCFDGATKSGLFRAVCDVISRMSYDRDVDVYMAVRHVQIARPESVGSLVQYRYLYHVIQEHQKRNAVYNNA